MLPGCCLLTQSEEGGICNFGSPYKLSLYGRVETTTPPLPTPSAAPVFPGESLWLQVIVAGIIDKVDPELHHGGVIGDMPTSDNGETWTVTTINIPKYSFVAGFETR